jgi:tetratricopeptide (TPR) repeat protein
MKKMYSNSVILMSALMLAPLLLYSQPEKGTVRSGNKAYLKNNFSEAEIKYRKAIEKNQASFHAHYNLGNALYKQDKMEEASRQYQAAANMAPDKNLAARDFHNLGNSYFKQQNFKESIEAYKQSLRLNPDDEETRYNLAYAQKMLKDQQQNQDNKNKDRQNQDKNKNQNENQQNKDQQQQEQKQQQEQAGQQQNADKRTEQPGKPEQKMSKEDAERLLQALRNNEKEIQKKLNKIEGQRIRTEKQW